MNSKIKNVKENMILLFFCKIILKIRLFYLVTIPLIINTIKYVNFI